MSSLCYVYSAEKEDKADIRITGIFNIWNLSIHGSHEL